MILMSKKMTSQKKLGEIKLVPFNKPLNSLTAKSVLAGEKLVAMHSISM
jgi:hypothetical protein